MEQQAHGRSNESYPSHSMLQISILKVVKRAVKNRKVLDDQDQDSDDCCGMFKA